jgi:hypothetical protein
MACFALGFQLDGTREQALMFVETEVSEFQEVSFLSFLGFHRKAHFVFGEDIFLEVVPPWRGVIP